MSGLVSDTSNKSETEYGGWVVAFEEDERVSYMRSLSFMTGELTTTPSRESAKALVTKQQAQRYAERFRAPGVFTWVDRLTGEAEDD